MSAALTIHLWGRDSWKVKYIKDYKNKNMISVVMMEINQGWEWLRESRGRHLNPIGMRVVKRSFPGRRGSSH